MVLAHGVLKQNNLKKKKKSDSFFDPFASATNDILSIQEDLKSHRAEGR